MKGLILKDLLNLKKSTLPILGFLVVYFVIAIISGNSGFFLGMIMVFCAILPISTLSYDERAGFEKYSLTMPISRSSIIVAKYFVALILLCIAGSLSLLLALLIDSAPFIETVFTVAFTMLISIAITSITLPPIVKFGVEKGRFIMVGLCALLGLFAGTFFMAATNGNFIISTDDNASSLVAIIDASFYPSVFSLFVMLIIGSIIFLASMLLSIKLYNTRNF